jgi:hypothetical protein
MKTSYVFWPCLFAFLIAFNQGFWEHEKQFLELDYQMKKPKSILDGLLIIPNLDQQPPLEFPIPKEDGPKKLDPKAGDTANDSQGNKSAGLPQSS